MRKLGCLRCGGSMEFVMQQKFQMGEHGMFLGDLPHLFAGSLELELYTCPGCGKVEFYVPEESEDYTDKALPQKQCPRCGKKHDFDYPKCPFCNHDYYA